MAPEVPYTISHDQGSEFMEPAMRDYLNSVGVKQRIKQSGAPNALGVVGRAILTLKKN